MQSIVRLDGAGQGHRRIHLSALLRGRTGIGRGMTLATALVVSVLVPSAPAAPPETAAASLLAEILTTERALRKEYPEARFLAF